MIDNALEKEGLGDTPIFINSDECESITVGTQSGGGSGDISIDYPSWADDGLTEDTIPPAGTKIAWMDFSHTPYHWIEVYDGNTPIGRATENFIGRCGDNFLFIYVYNG